MTVPPDFRFTVDGKQLSVSDLKPGMKGTATVTTTTTIRPVYVTEMREGQVMRASDQSITVKQGDDYKQVHRRGSGCEGHPDLQGWKARPDRRSQERRQADGDHHHDAAAPAVLTQQEVQATLAEAPAASPPPTTVAARGSGSRGGSCGGGACGSGSDSGGGSGGGGSRGDYPGGCPCAEPPLRHRPQSTGMSMTTWLLIAIAIALVLFLFLRRRKEA